MAAIALSVLRERAAARAAVTLSSDGRYPPALVDGYINEALEEYMLVLVDAGHPQRETRATASTATGSTLSNGWPTNEFVALPADFMQLREVFVTSGATRVPLRPFEGTDASMDAGWLEQSTGQPERYRISRGTDGTQILRLLPPVDAVYTITIVYTPTITQLVADSSTFDFFPGTAEYVVCDAALKLLENDGVQEGAQFQAITLRRDRAEQRLSRYARKANRAGPSAMKDVRSTVRRAVGGYLS